MSDKPKTSDPVTFAAWQYAVFYGGWLLLGTLGTVVSGAVGLAMCVTFGRDAVFAIFAGNLGNLILNLLVLALGCGVGLLAAVIAWAGLKLPWDEIIGREPADSIKYFRESWIQWRYDQPGKEDNP